MKIRFLFGVAGANFAYRPKKIYDLRDDLAQDFIRTGRAVAVETPAAPAQEELAVAGERETAARRTGGNRRRKSLGGLLGLH